MNLNINECISEHMIFYRLEPGDGTCYRFGFCRVPESHHSSVIADGMHGEESDFIFISISMPGGSGCGVLRISQLRDMEANPYHVSYAQNHGFEHVYLYTLAAVMLALSVLVDNSDDLLKAGEAMLHTRNYLAGNLKRLHKASE